MNKPENGEKSPNDPADKPYTANKEDPAKPKDPEAVKWDTWVTQLPPEVRDAVDGGKIEMIPVRYRQMVRKYLLFLQKNAK